MRPAVFVTTRVERAALPLGGRLRAFGQAGYVGGKFKTAFVDGFAEVDREVARFELGTLTVGAGLRGGAQRGAERLDIGPLVALETEIGDLPVRISADYRLKVAGDAKPGNGAALTITSGF